MAAEMIASVALELAKMVGGFFARGLRGHMCPPARGRGSCEL